MSGHRRRTVAQTLAALAASTHARHPADAYGRGDAIGDLETRVASLLGKPAALFTIKGVVAQQSALRAWTDRTGCRNVVLHPKSHIDLDEQGAYQRLHHLQPIRLGLDHAPFTSTDLDTVREPIGAVVLELPLRRAGYRLPDWTELEAMSAWCRERAVPLHVDGARLWEAQPFYARPLHEIAALSDSVYVSFYKGLGGLGGAILCGSEALVAEARVWHARHCGALATAFPFVISALDGLDHHLPRMAAYVERAKTLAASLAELARVTVPHTPRTNAFGVYFAAPAAVLEARHLACADSRRVWLFERFQETALPDLTMAEITVGDAIEDLQTPEIIDLVGQILDAG